MLTSYSTIMGPAIISCENTSGGVRMAATTKMAKMAYLRTSRIFCAVMRPIRAKKKLNSGISKISPKASTILSAKLKYSSIDSIATILSVE